MDSGRLANYEFGRVPLRFGLVDRYARLFNLNQRWLAEGRGAAAPYWIIPPKILQEIRSDALFSEAYDEHLQPEFGESSSFGQFALSVIVDSVPPAFTNAEDEQFYRKKTLEHLDAVFDETPMETRGKLLKIILNTIASFCVENSVAIAKYRETGNSRRQKNPLTHVSESANQDSVKLQMANLLARLNKATTRRGMKSELAKFIGVPLSNISQWLSGEREPGGETTLQLLKWVEQQERK